jgi:hypothetical protein
LIPERITVVEVPTTKPCDGAPTVTVRTDPTSLYVTLVIVTPVPEVVAVIDEPEATGTGDSKMS